MVAKRLSVTVVAGLLAALAFGWSTQRAEAQYYYAPAPVYVVPQTVCQDYVTQGYWRQVTVTDPSGAPMVQNQWVPGSVQRVCQ